MDAAKDMLVNTVLHHTAGQLTVVSVAAYLKRKSLLCDLVDMDCQYLQMVHVMADEELMESLLRFHIHAPTVPSRELMVQVLYTVKENSFWRDHYTIHPNAYRVRPWLASHGYIRRMMCDVQAKVRALKHLDPPALTNPMLDDIRCSFQSLHSAVQQHNELEIRVLFHALAQHVLHDIGALDHLLFVNSDAYYPDQILKCIRHMQGVLTNDQDNPPTASTGTSSFTDCHEHDVKAHAMLAKSILATNAATQDTDAMQQFMDVYFDSIENKLREEEVAVTVRWLTLSFEAHRTILSQLPAEAKHFVYRTPSAVWTAPP
ncbi:hypothetical protein DYB32_006321 [Aphanomyces invadans]|uniref:Hemerythrin-like domain-containing protein n=1 Tax=Aphanomyces invadans TaxID=157072 RepID=A0A3R6VV58_9STRA|nr:hypothetical protein DYB32_006321 [Aphanomyces invadans]